jgi:hypothetical protein
MIIAAPLLRQIHKWIGLVLGLQFAIWAASGATMALVDMDEVAGGKKRASPAPMALPAASSWPSVKASLGSEAISGVTVRPLLGRHVFEIGTSGGIRLFDAATARPIVVDSSLARKVAELGYAGSGRVSAVVPLRNKELAVREHELPIWRVDFADAANSSFYVSGETGNLLERRNDSWRIWDFAWMLHNMDYARRTSFNHPLIVTFACGILWLAITGFWLLFRTKWRPDLRRLGRLGRKGRTRRVRQGVDTGL